MARLRLMLLGAVVACGIVGVARGDVPKGVKVVVEAERGDGGEYFVGEPVLLKYGVTNVSDAVVKLNSGGDYRGGTRPSRFIVMATDEKGVKLPDPDPVQMMFGGLGGDREIKPGETLWMSVAPLRYCLIDKAGTYTFRVGHDLGLIGERYGAKPPEPADYPMAEITLKFKVPDEAQAAKIVDNLLVMKDTGNVMGFNARPEGDLRRDFATLRLPVYLKTLQKYAEQGKAEVVAGIGSIETPEATRLLIELLKSPTPAVLAEVGWPLRQRLPKPTTGNVLWGWQQGQDATGRHAAVVKASWRPEFAADLRAFSVRELEKGTSATAGSNWNTLGEPAYYLIMIGEKEDAPAVYKALDAAIEKNERYPSPVIVSVMDPRDVADLQEASRVLMARGAAPPEGTRLCAPVIEMLRIRTEKSYRPEVWQREITGWLGDSRGYYRQCALVTLSSIPEPIWDEAKVKVGDLLKDPDPTLRLAAIQAVGRSGDRDLCTMVLWMMRTANDDGVLIAGRNALEQSPLRMEWLDLCVMRMTYTQKWNTFFEPLLGTLDDLSGGWKSGTVAPRDQRIAQQQWQEFLAKHREEIAAGKKVPLDQADERMVPAPYSLTRKSGGTWPR